MSDSNHWQATALPQHAVNCIPLRSGDFSLWIRCIAQRIQLIRSLKTCDTRQPAPQIHPLHMPDPLELRHFLRGEHNALANSIRSFPLQVSQILIDR